jgi:hypothetical protein
LINEGTTVTARLLARATALAGSIAYTLVILDLARRGLDIAYLVLMGGLGLTAVIVACLSGPLRSEVDLAYERGVLDVTEDRR